MAKNLSETVLVISDTQAPFHHKDTLVFLEHLKKKHKPTKIVHIGDLTDQHANSRFPKDPDGYSSGHELKAAMPFLEALYQLFPKAVLLDSNHDRRFLERIREVGLSKEYARKFLEVVRAPKGWSMEDFIIIDGVKYEHGEKITKQNAALAVAKNDFRSTVIGHLHSQFGVTYFANQEFLVFGVSVGCLMDHKSYAAAYGKMCPVKPIVGTFVIKNGIPIPEPMVLNSKGRWVEL